MKKTNQHRYKRLPGKATGLYRRVRLWLGHDHLLAVESNTYQESYQRYYFKDIQGILIRKTARGKILNGVVGVPTALAGLKLMSIWNGDPLWLWFWGLGGEFLLLLLLGNILQGPTCVTYIRTPISTTKLPSLHRLRTARKVRDRLRSLVEQEQGRLDREQIRQTAPPPQAALPTAKGSGRSAGRPAERGPASPAYAGWAHWMLLACCLALAGFLTLYLYSNGPAMAGAGLLLAATLLVFNTFALAKQAGSSAPPGVKAFAWSVMGLLFLTMGAGYFGMLFSLMRGGQIKPMFNQWSLFVSMAQLRPMESPFLSGVFIVGAIGLLAAALFGAISLIDWRRRAGRFAVTAPVRTTAGTD